MSFFQSKGQQEELRTRTVAKPSLTFNGKHTTKDKGNKFLKIQNRVHVRLDKACLSKKKLSFKGKEREKNL